MFENEIEIINNLVKLRKKKGISTYTLAETTGFSQSKVSKIENFNKKLSVDELIVYLNALGLTLKDFFTEEKEVPNLNKNLYSNLEDLTLKNKKDINKSIERYSTEIPLKLPQNILFTGVPGSGKTYNLKNFLKIVLDNFKKTPKIYLFNLSNFEGDWVYKEYKPFLDGIYENIVDYQLEYIDVPVNGLTDSNDNFFKKLSEILKQNEVSVLIMDNFNFAVKNPSNEVLLQKILKKEGIYCYMASQYKDILHDETLEYMEQYHLIKNSNQLDFMQFLNVNTDIDSASNSSVNFDVFNIYLNKLKAKGLVDATGVKPEAEEILKNALEIDIKLNYLSKK